MKLLSLNVELGLNNAEPVAEIIKLHRPDFICLQEVGHALESSTSEKYRFKEEFDAINISEYPFRFWSPLSETRGERKEEVTEFKGLLQQGNYILSKHPLLLGDTIFYYQNYKYIPYWEKKHYQTGRAFQRIVAKVEGKRLQIINNHGIIRNERLGNEETDIECRLILKASKENSIPTIITGDFNLLPSSQSLTVLFNEYEELVTKNDFITTRPKPKTMIVDYMFIKDIRVESFNVLESQISNHYPLIIEFNL